MTSDSSYRAAGVDDDAAEKAVRLIGRHARTTFNTHVLGDIGFFGGLYQLGDYREPVLVSSTDGVGTKVRIASLLGRFESVGADLVNQCVNDIIVAGARPLFFLDYMAMGSLVPEKAGALAKGMASACREIDCVLIGGETAEMPGIYSGEDFDLAGFVVGVVEKDGIIDGSSITPDDTVIGIPSSGIHSNGFSLVRKVFGIDAAPGPLDAFYPELGRTLGEELLETHLCYHEILKDLLPSIKGMAHITGGGLVGNVPRILPEGLTARLDPSSWTAHPIFRLIREKGRIPIDEMYRVFNMGLGMVVVCSPEKADDLCGAVPGASIVGEIVTKTDDEGVVIEQGDR